METTSFGLSSMSTSMVVVSLTSTSVVSTLGLLVTSSVLVSVGFSSNAKNLYQIMISYLYIDY
jgi:hypothetical protein